MPGRTNSTARAAAARFWASTSIAIETVGPRDCINDGRLSSPVRPESIVHLRRSMGERGHGRRAACHPPHHPVAITHDRCSHRRFRSRWDAGRHRARSRRHAQRHLRRAMGLPPVAYDAARNMVGGGARAMIERGLGRRRAASSTRPRSTGWSATSSRTMPRTLRIAPGHSPALKRHSTSSRRLAAAWRSAPTSSNGCRCGCSMRSACRSALWPFAGRTRSGCRSPTRNCCDARSRAPTATPGARSWSGTPSATSPPPARQAFRSSRSTYGYTETPVGELEPDRVISTLSDLPKAVFDLLGRRRAAFEPQVVNGYFTLSAPHLGAFWGANHTTRGSGSLVARGPARFYGCALGMRAAVCRPSGGIQS